MPYTFGLGGNDLLCPMFFADCSNSSQAPVLHLVDTVQGFPVYFLGLGVFGFTLPCLEVGLVSHFHVVHVKVGAVQGLWFTVARSLIRP